MTIGWLVSRTQRADGGRRKRIRAWPWSRSIIRVPWMHLLEELIMCMHAQLTTLLTLFQIGVCSFFYGQVPNRLGHGVGRLAVLALDGRRSFIVSAQQDTSKLPLAAVSTSEEDKSGWVGGEEAKGRPQNKHSRTSKNSESNHFNHIRFVVIHFYTI